ncbi:hypothetical protein [Streptomyces sp. NPDC053079]|uniref:hypothetical protein n=1 Tax=Streptomyces sp. NPDC053079 TaxID=3365697 RepID=UPI0037D58505
MALLALLLAVMAPVDRAQAESAAPAASAGPVPGTAPVLGPQLTDWSGYGLLRVCFPPFLASLASGGVLAISSWGIRKLGGRQGPL